MKSDLSELDRRRVQRWGSGWVYKINALGVIATASAGWDHVSVSHPTRIPYWSEMCYIKSLFFESDEVVMQLHPAEENYVNDHPRCLHLWRPQDAAIPLPPPECV